MKSVQPQDIERFLLRAYFGEKLNLAKCIDRAYLDFCRTLTHVKDHPDLRPRAHVRLVEHLRMSEDIRTQSGFNGWHRQTCDNLVDVYRPEFPLFTVGHAQKWVNMTLKYILVLGEDRVPGYGHLYEYLHVPLDRIIVEKIKADGYCPQFNKAWSKIDNYDDYFDTQLWIRSRYPEEQPMAVKFRRWMSPGDL